jgi:hypothetical protein
MASRQRADFGDGFGHLQFTPPSQPNAASRESGGASNFHAGQHSNARLQIGPDARGRPTSISDETKWQTKALSIAA